jgi:hypothetical protein
MSKKSTVKTIVVKRLWSNAQCDRAIRKSECGSGTNRHEKAVSRLPFEASTPLRST